MIKGNTRYSDIRKLKIPKFFTSRVEAPLKESNLLENSENRYKFICFEWEGVANLDILHTKLAAYKIR